MPRLMNFTRFLLQRLYRLQIDSFMASPDSKCKNHLWAHNETSMNRNLCTISHKHLARMVVW